MKVNIRCSNGDTFAVNDVDLNQTVGEFKQVVADQSQIPASDQRLIYRGKVLKDQATLKSYGVEDGLTVHLVRGTPKPATPSATTTTSSTTATSTTTSTPTTTTTTPTPTTSTPPTSTPSNNTTNQQQNPFNMFGGMGGMGNLLGNMGNGGMPNMDPNTMQQMMNNPMVQSLLNNPDFIREIMSTNPQMQEIMRNNPEVGRMLQDPEMIRRAMEMSRNPELMREMMRNTDLALNNIENLPGGFDALRRMYSDVQEPLHEATSEMLRQPNQPSTTSNQTSVPSGQPFNMWGNNQPSTGTTTNTNTTTSNNNNSTTGTNQNTNPFSMFGNMGGLGGMGGMPNMGGMGMPNMNPQQVQQMMNNPFMQQMMQQMLSDPNTLDQLIGSNPMLQQMTQQNPMLRTMLGNPQFIQQVMQMQGLLNQTQPNTNTTTNPGTTGTTGTTPTNPFENLQQMMQGMNLGGNTGGQNPFASMFGNQFMAPQTNQQPPRERFANQLSQLQEMGFFDEQSNIEALLVANGNVNAAIEYLLSNPPPSRN